MKNGVDQFGRPLGEGDPGYEPDDDPPFEDGIEELPTDDDDPFESLYEDEDDEEGDDIPDDFQLGD